MVVLNGFQGPQEAQGQAKIGPCTTPVRHVVSSSLSKTSGTGKTSDTTGGKSSAPAPKGGLAGADDFPSGPWSTLEEPWGSGGPLERVPRAQNSGIFGAEISPPWGAPIDH